MGGGYFSVPKSALARRDPALAISRERQCITNLIGSVFVFLIPPICRIMKLGENLLLSFEYLSNEEEESIILSMGARSGDENINLHTSFLLSLICLVRRRPAGFKAVILPYLSRGRRRRPS